VGENPDYNRELFLYDLVEQELRQVTHTVGGVSISNLSEEAQVNNASIAAGGFPAVYRSEQALDLPDGNPENNLELFITVRTHSVFLPVVLR